MQQNQRVHEQYIKQLTEHHQVVCDQYLQQLQQLDNERKAVVAQTKENERKRLENEMEELKKRMLGEFEEEK